MKILFLKCGEAPSDLAARCGDYEHWFRRAMDEIGWDTVRPNTGPMPRVDLSEYAGLIISGSPRSVTSPEPWMEETAALAREAHQKGIPTLGVCFGHQLLAWAHGSRVVRNPRGWELGTVEIHITSHGSEDPLFLGIHLEGRLQANATHEDAVDETALPSHVRVLAENTVTPVQAIAVGDHTRGVQFHPEVTGEISREYCLRRAHLVGEERAQALAATATDTPSAQRILANFLDHFVRRT